MTGENASLSSLTFVLGSDPTSTSEETDGGVVLVVQSKADIAQQRSRLSNEKQIRTESNESLQLLRFIVGTYGDLLNLYDPMELAAWVPFLPSGSGEVEFHIEGRDGNTNEKEQSSGLQLIQTSLLLSGLVGSSEKRLPASGGIIITAKRPASKTIIQSEPIRAKAISATPKVILNLDAEDDDDLLIDEDDLLLEAPVPPAMAEQASKSADDCSGRKPCDDCTCGRAEREAGANDAASSLSKEPVKTSGCGNCAKGDAFRCAGCPYLGKPAFKPGEEHLVLDLTDDL